MRPAIINRVPVMTIAAGLLLVLFSIGSSRPAYGAGGDIVWQYRHTKAALQEATAMAVDSDGNTIITGYTQAGSDDFYTVKVQADGSGVSWFASYNQPAGNAGDKIAAVAVDSDDNVIVTGYVFNGSNLDFHTIKYNGVDGVVLWQHSFNAVTNSNDYPTSVTVDSLNNVYVGGYAQASGGSDDFMLIKYGPDGPNPDGTPLWKKSYNGPAASHDRITDAVAGSDGIAVTGYSQNASANFDYYTIKYGFDGSVIWEKRLDSGSGSDRGLHVKMDHDGHVVVSGELWNGTDKDINTIKYDGANGTVLWQRTYASPDGAYPDELKSLLIDAAGDVYVTGSTFTLTGFTDLYTAKYSGVNGALLWNDVYNSAGGNTDMPVAMVADGGGDVYVTGYTHKDASADDDFLTIKYKQNNGNRLWLKNYDGTANKDDKAIGIGLAGTGEVLVAGWSDNWTSGASDYDYYVIKYDPGLLNPPTGLAATVVSDTALDLAWSDNSGNEDGFAIWRKEGDLGVYSQIATVAANATTYNDTGLNPHVWYYYKVKAYNAANGDSHFSSEASALTTFISYAAPAWEYIFDGADGADDFAHGLAAGPDNHPVVTGKSYSTTGTFDYYTVKINRADATEMWSARYNDADDEMDEAAGVTVDANNNVVVTGFSSLYGGGAANTNDLFTIKYASTGPPQFGDPDIWNDQYNGAADNDDRAVSVATAIDGSNNIAVVGYGKNSSANDDIYVIKYQSSGARAWVATPYNGAAGGNDYPAAAAFDGSGNLVVAGKTHNGGNYDILVRKYNGANGSPVWTVVNNQGFGWDDAYDLAIDQSGDVYVAGFITSGLNDEDFYTAKYSGADGSLVWEKSIDGPGLKDDVATAVRVDPISGDIVVAGTVLSAIGNHDFQLVRYSASGDVVWSERLERVSNDDIAVAMGIDGSGNVCVAGNTDNGATIDGMAVKYDHLGNILGATIYNGAADNNDDAEAVAVNNLGEAYVTGYTTNASGNADYLVFKCAGVVMLAPSPFTTTPYYTTVNLSWTDNTSDEDGFYLERKLGACDSANDWELILTAAADATSHTDTALTPETLYCYRIQAFKDSGETSRWNTETATTVNPPAPTGFSATAVNTTRIDLAWTDNTSNEDGFKIERCSGAGCSDFSELALVAANVTTYSDTSLCESTTYSYRILAYKTETWQSPFSSVDAGNTTTAKTAPTSLTATRISEGEIKLAWTDNSTDETGFQIERCAGSACSDFALLTTAAANAATYNDTTGIIVNTTYRYQVRATKTASCGWNTDYATVAEATATLVAPSGFSASVINTTRIDLAWTDNTTYETGFAIERCQGAGCSDFAEITTVGANVTSYSDTGVCESIVYNYQVRAVKSTVTAWNSSYASASATTNSMAAPSGLSATRLNEEQISLSWTDNASDESGYEIERCEGAGCSNFALITTTGAGATTYTDSNLTPGATYRYQVRAVKSATCAWNTAYTATAEAVTTLDLPGSLDAAIANTTQINLTWADNTANETGFVIERCQGGGCTDFAAIAAAGAGVTSYADTGVCNSTAYSYQVKAINNGLSSNGLGDCWTKRKPLTITSFAANSLVSFTVSYGSDMQSDFDDLRFYDETAGQELSYWIGSKTNGTSAAVWLKTGSNNNINMYYGNATAASSSNASALFEFYDNFQGTTIDGAKWVEIDPASKIAQNNGLNLSYVNTSWDAALISQQTFARAAGKIFYAKVNSQNSTWSDYVMMGWELNQTANASYSQLVHGLYWVDSYYRIYQKNVDYGYTTYLTYTRTNTNYEVKIELKSAGAKYYVRGGAYADWQLIMDRSDQSDSPMRVAITQLSHQARIDFAAVTSYNLLNSTVTAGAEAGSGCYAFANTWSSSASSPDSATTTAPAAPSALAATAASESQINLTWTDNTSDETGFKVERCEGTGCSNFAEIGSTAAGVASYSDTGLTMATTYNYRVQAYKTASCGWDQIYSNTKETTTLSPPAPSSLVASPVNTTQINLVWTDNTGAETGFVIERCEGAGCSNFAQIATVAANVTTYPDTGVCNTTTYTYRVMANNETIPWTTDPSNTSTAVSSSLPAVPALTATRISEAQINLAWTDNATDETGFKIERCAGTGCSDFAELATAGAGVTSYSNNSGLAAATVYCYRTKAYKDATCGWNGGYSDTACLETTISAPGNLIATPVNTTQVDLSWTDNTASETGFEIDRCLGLDCSDFALLTTAGAGATSYSDTSVANSNTYQYRVRAVSGTWNSGNASTVVITPTPAAPSGLLAARISEAQINVSWTDRTSDETNFRVERGDADCANFAEIATTGAGVTTYQDSGRAAATTYCYRVRAYKSATSEWYTGYSNTNTATTSVAAPSGLSATVVNTTRINLTWTDNTVSETGFEVERCEGSGCSNFVLTGSTAAGSNTYSDTTVCNTEIYSYRVRAVKSGEWASAFSNIAADKTTPSPAAPSGFSVAIIAEDQINLSWTDNSNDESEFEIERCEGAGCSDYAFLATAAADSIAYSDATLDPSSTYCYRVRAVKDAACGWESAYSNESCDLTLSATPTGLIATALSSKAIKLDWTDNAVDEDGYEIEERIWNGKYILLGTVAADTVTFTTTLGIEAETSYTYRVRAFRGSDNSAYSNEAEVTTPAWQAGDEVCQ